jgi:hypothetical protein
LVTARTQAFVSSAKSLLNRVNDAIEANERKFQRLRRQQQSFGVGKGLNHKQGSGFNACARLSFDSITVPLTSQTQNLLRLILTWCCNKNILRSQIKKGVAREDYYTVHVKSPKLTESSVRSIFGTVCNWKLQKTGTRVYLGSVSMEGRSALQVVAETARHSNVPFVWAVYDVTPESSEFYFALQNNYSKEVTQLEKRLLRMYAELKEVMKLEIDNHNQVVAAHSKRTEVAATYKVYMWTCADSAQEAEIINSMEDLHDIRVVLCMGLHDNPAINPESREGSLYCYGIDKLSKSSLSDIFYGMSPEKYEVRQGLADSDQIIQFPDPIKDHPTGSMFIDVPVGMKILNTCKMLYKDKLMKLRSIGFYDNGGSGDCKSDAPSLTVGTKAWRDSKDARNNTDETPTEYETCQLQMKTLSNDWGFSTRKGRVSLSKNSYLYPSRHCGNDVMFCTSYNIVENRTGDSVQYYAEGLTMLPLGGHWLTMAMLCNAGSGEESESAVRMAESYCGKLGDIIAKKLSGSRQSTAEEDSRPRFTGLVNGKLTAENRDLCDEFRHHLQIAVETPLEYNPLLVSLANKIFQDWYSIGNSAHLFGVLEKEFEIRERVDSSRIITDVDDMPGRRPVLSASSSSSPRVMPTSATTSREFASGPPIVKLVKLEQSGANNSYGALSISDDDSESDTDKNDEELNGAVGGYNPVAVLGELPLGSAYDECMFQDRFGGLNLNSFVKVDKRKSPTVIDVGSAASCIDGRATISRAASKPDASIQASRMSDNIERKVTEPTAKIPIVTAAAMKANKSTDIQATVSPIRQNVASATDKLIFMMGDHVKTAHIWNSDVNDKEGFISKDLDVSTGRYGVKIAIPKGNNSKETVEREIQVRPENLLRLTPLQTVSQQWVSSTTVNTGLAKVEIFKLNSTSNVPRRPPIAGADVGQIVTVPERCKCAYCGIMVEGSDDLLEAHVLAVHTFFCSICDESIMECVQCTMHFKRKHKMQVDSMEVAKEKGLLVQSGEYEKNCGSNEMRSASIHNGEPWDLRRTDEAMLHHQMETTVADTATSTAQVKHLARIDESDKANESGGIYCRPCDTKIVDVHSGFLVSEPSTTKVEGNVEPLKDSGSANAKKRRCAFCRMEIGSKKEVRKHEAKEHPKINCSDCGKSLDPRALSIQQHMASKHATVRGRNIVPRDEGDPALPEVKRTLKPVVAQGAPKTATTTTRGPDSEEDSDNSSEDGESHNDPQAARRFSNVTGSKSPKTQNMNASSSACYACDFCGLSMKSQKMVRKHVKVSHKSVCKLCMGLWLFTATDVSSHLKRKHNIVIGDNINFVDYLVQSAVCQLCRVLKLNQEKLMAHTNRVHTFNGIVTKEPPLIPCGICQRSLRPSPSGLHLHLQQLHPDIPKRGPVNLTKKTRKLCCAMCGQLFETEKATAEHIVSMHAKTGFVV